jgi:hypothetical protein
MEKYTGLAITSLDEFVFGRCPRPLKVGRGLVLGDGTVYPELNFTLPPMHIDAGTMVDVRREYTEMIDQACARAVALQVPGLVVEFELLPDLTLQPGWGAEVTALLRQALDRYAASDGLANALRVTPNDIREFVRPPVLRQGDKWDRMVSSFELCAQAGADLLSIESTGGKELHDDALLNADLAGSVFALGILAARDMAYLWDMIVAVAAGQGALAAGDSACGFGNTAMALADTRHIPKVWAALVRVMTVPRSLVAYERGAVGPGKDCAYENVYLKAITGHPMAMEGAEAACAHLSPLGNIAKATADLWSNDLEVGGRHRGRAHRLPAHPAGGPGHPGGPAPGPCPKGVLAQQTGGPLAGPAVGPSRGPARGRGPLHRGNGGRGRPGQSPLRPVRPRRLGHGRPRPLTDKRRPSTGTGLASAALVPFASSREAAWYRFSHNARSVRAGHARR